MIATLDQTEIAGVLAGHVVKGEYDAAAVIAAGCVELETLAGNMLGIKFDGETVTVNGVTVVETDVKGTGGILHGVDAVILPDTFTPCMMDDGMGGSKMPSPAMGMDDSEAPTMAPEDSGAFSTMASNAFVGAIVALLLVAM